MKKKTFAAIALTSCMVLSAALTGCSLISTNNRLDMEQVIATVDISKSDKFGTEFANYGNAVSPKKIIKRELVSYFINVGYSYIQSNYTYEQTFNALMDALVSNAVLVQYSTVAILNNAAVNDNSDIVDGFNNGTDEVSKYEALLSEDQVNLAYYKLYSSINSAIDSYEKKVIEEEDDGYTGSGTRTTPTNLNTEQDDYYPGKENGKLDYAIYTGYNGYLLDDSGAYKDDALDGTTRSTRIKAYNTFLNNLRRNNLIDENKDKNLIDVLSLEYIKTEKISQLESRIINSYYDIYEEGKKEELLNIEYVKNEYNDVFAAQKENYGNSTSAFESAMGSMSSSSFILYSPDTSDSNWEAVDGVSFSKYGFIYNILLPFNASQTVELNALKSQLTDDGDDDAYFAGRNKILEKIKTVDQRSVWFNGETDYSFKPENENFYNGGEKYRNYLFFENNFNDREAGEKYKKLQAYDGRYSYNGKVIENEDESYTLIPNKLDIDDMLAEFSAYVNYVLNDGNTGSNHVTFDKDGNFFTREKFYKDPDEKDEINYSLLTYVKGKVDFGAFKNSDLMNPESDQYKAMSAVNELQFAYTTDTSVLSNYIGYSLTAYDTSYIKEFEYAAKDAVGRGPGSFAVCAGDYGWHLIYVTYVFDYDESNGVYKNLDWENNIDKEGTFENLFYEWVKNKDLTNVSTTLRAQILNKYNEDATVKKYQDRYQDLLDIGK